MPTKVKDSFEHQLPNLPIQPKGRKNKKDDGNKRKKLNVKESSKSTTLAPAIEGYVEENAVDLVTKARQRLRSAKDIQEYIRGIVSTFLLVNEADVFRAAGLYLVHPINMLLPALFPGVNLRVFCNSEVSANNESRFDMRWLLCRPGKAHVAAAILEYKAPNSLQRIEFQKGKFSAGEAEKNMSMAEGLKFGTWFEDNAIPLSK